MDYKMRKMTKIHFSFIRLQEKWMGFASQISSNMVAVEGKREEGKIKNKNTYLEEDD